MGRTLGIIDRLASSLGRRDEVPNQVLAQDIVDRSDAQAIQDLMLLLAYRERAIQNDSIKVLYEIGRQKPDLIVGHADIFLTVLKSKNNRLQWGAMAALDCIAKVNKELIWEHLPLILKVADSGSVITRDHAVNILIKLMEGTVHEEQVFPLLMDQLLRCPPNQLPMYAERVSSIVVDDNQAVFLEVLNSRLQDVEKETKRKRLVKIMRRLT